MKDEELILRFFAMYYKLEEYKKPMNEFLSKFMIKNKNILEERLLEMEKLFINTIGIISSKIGLAAFRPKRNLNMAAFDSVMYIVAKFPGSLRDDLKEAIKKLFEDPAYLKAIREGTTDEETIKSRMKMAKRYLTNEK